MNNTALVIMSAGMGSRYGSQKQIEPVGPNNECILDYSIYDALEAGFNKVVFVIKEEFHQSFRETIGKKIEGITDTAYVFQKNENVPSGFRMSLERKKPWGTAHAVLSANKAVDTPFAVINADDFYGKSTFRVLHDGLLNLQDRNVYYNYCMVGFTLYNTLSEHGQVARGICSVNQDGYLNEIKERTKIVKIGDNIKFTQDDKNWTVIPSRSIVSMNVWGFTPSIFEELKVKFKTFLECNNTNLLTDEFFIPSVVNELIKEKKAKVQVLNSGEKWYGITYKEDKQNVEKAIYNQIKQGIYPEKLYEKNTLIW